jgi:hypothetical protein
MKRGNVIGALARQVIGEVLAGWGALTLGGWVPPGTNRL